MKLLPLILVFVGIVLVLAGLVSALGVKLDVVKQCDPSGGAYATTWTGTVNDTSGTPLPSVFVAMFDYGPDMIQPFQTAATGTGGNSGFYIAQFPVWLQDGGRRYEIDARKTGYDTASIFVVLPCFEDVSTPIQQGQERYVLYANFTLNPVQKLQAGFVYSQSYGRTDFFDRSSGGPDQWTWTWGDGSADVITTLASIEHNYSAAGTYTVRMKAQRVFTNPATSYAFANVTVTVASPPGGGPAPPPPAPTPPPCDPLTDPSCPGYQPPTGGQSDNPPPGSTSGGGAESPNGPDPQQPVGTSTIVTPSGLTVLLIILGIAAFAAALVASRT